MAVSFDGVFDGEPVGGVGAGVGFDVEAGGYGGVVDGGGEGGGVCLGAGFRMYVRIGGGVEAGGAGLGYVVRTVGVLPGAFGGLDDSESEAFGFDGVAVDIRLVVGDVDAVVDRWVALFRGGGWGGAEPGHGVDLGAGAPFQGVDFEVQVWGVSAVGVGVGVDVGDALSSVYPLPYGYFADDAAVHGGAAAGFGGVVDDNPAGWCGPAEATGGAGVHDGAGLGCVHGLVSGSAGFAEVHTVIGFSIIGAEAVGDVAVVGHRFEACGHGVPLVGRAVPTCYRNNPRQLLAFLLAFRRRPARHVP